MYFCVVMCGKGGDVCSLTSAAANLSPRHCFHQLHCEVLVNDTGYSKTLEDYLGLSYQGISRYKLGAANPGTAGPPDPAQPRHSIAGVSTPEKVGPRNEAVE
jgi:hypothetical protein